MKVDLHYGMDPPFGPNTHETQGVGGTENFITYSAEYLARAGVDVRVYNKIAQMTKSDAGVSWLPLAHFNPSEQRDVLMSFRVREVFEQPINAGLTVLALADTESHGLGDAVRNGQVGLVMFVSQWQADKIRREEGIDPFRTMVTSNGVAMERFDELRGKVKRIAGKCIHLATPERGLEPLLDIWPAIQAEVSGAELHLFSSFLGWRTTAKENEAMCVGVYARIESMQADGACIINHKHASAQEIRRHLLESELYLYPTRHFDETCCISALEASAAGIPIIATARGAMVERVRDGITGYLTDEGDQHDEHFAGQAIALLFQPFLWGAMSAGSMNMAQRYDYAWLVNDWLGKWGR